MIILQMPRISYRLLRLLSVELTLLFVYLGTTLIVFSLVRMRAACTGSPKFAKLFMAVCPFVLVFDVVMILRAAMAALTITSAVQINLCMEIFFCVYYFKVKPHPFCKLKSRSGAGIFSPSSPGSALQYLSHGKDYVFFLIIFVYRHLFNPICRYYPRIYLEEISG